MTLKVTAIKMKGSLSLLLHVDCCLPAKFSLKYHFERMHWWWYRTGVLSDIEWLNTTQLKYPDCVCIVESDTYPSPGVTRLCPSWLGTWLTWSPSGHCNMQWDTFDHLVAMAAGRELLNNHITRLHHEEYWYIYIKLKTPKWHSNRYPVVLILNLLV